ncbi:MAG: ABC transporter permease subunit [Acidimicrobiales bacterium]|nr:ABC transporter permease subunit [Acidimicrobiales bacterium]
MTFTYRTIVGGGGTATPERPRPDRTYSGWIGTTVRRVSWADVVVFLGVLGLLYGVVAVSKGTTATFSAQSVASVDTSPSRLPYDAARSLLRMFVALAASYAFTLVYGYVAARNRRAEKVLIPALDILQSVPILGFLSITVTGFIALFPGSYLGLEMASTFAIFTSQAWNLTFSFYNSLTTQPADLDEAARLLGLSRWRRFWKLDVPSGAIGLVWNGMMSMGGGWFFLVASEAISVLNRDYALPGIGSYVGAAIHDGELSKVGLGVAVMAVVVVGVNFVFWRPLVAWAERFKNEQTESAVEPRSLVLDLLRRSHWPRKVGQLRRRLAEPVNRLGDRVFGHDRFDSRSVSGRGWVDVAFTIAGVGAAVVGVVELVRYVTAEEGLTIFVQPLWQGLLTLCRVVILVVVSTVVWVPVGVRIGLSPKASRIAQPVVQVLASFPANFLFPFAVWAFVRTGLTLDVGGIFLMALGAQWYILFNAIAGAQAIPSDLRDAVDDLGVSGWLRWKRLYLPAVVPAYVTGGITASGGAWNASIVAEVVTYGGTTLTATGLGAYIARATAVGDFHEILAGVAVMALYIVGINRLFWHRLYRVAERRYALA